MLQNWAVRAGYAYIQGAIPDTHILPCKPDADAHEIDLGAGKKLGNWKIDLEQTKRSKSFLGHLHLQNGLFLMIHSLRKQDSLSWKNSKKENL